MAVHVDSRHMERTDRRYISPEEGAMHDAQAACVIPDPAGLQLPLARVG